jgi:predicted HicB family RNase H-like nuclease
MQTPPNDVAYQDSVHYHSGVSYLLRNIDQDLWRRVKSKAALEGVSVNALILRLLTEWVNDDH